MARWTRHGHNLWIEEDATWTGRTSTAEPTSPVLRDQPPPGSADDQPIWFREDGPTCAPGRLSPPCPWELRWPASLRQCPVEALAPWWAALGPWTECGPRLAPSLVWSHALFTAGARDPEAEQPRMELDPVRGTCIAAQSHLGADGLVVEARHQFRRSDVGRSGSLLALVSPTLAGVKDMASVALTHVDLAEVRAFVPLSAITSIEARRTFSTTRPLLGPARRTYDQFGHGPLDSARVTIRLFDGWRRHAVTLATDGKGSGWAYETRPFEQWVVALAAAVGRVRPVRPEVVEDTPYRWARSFACDRASPLGIAAERVLAGSA